DRLVDREGAQVHPGVELELVLWFERRVARAREAGDQHECDRAAEPDPEPDQHLGTQAHAGLAAVGRARPGQCASRLHRSCVRAHETLGLRSRSRQPRPTSVIMKYTVKAARTSAAAITPSSLLPA